MKSLALPALLPLVAVWFCGCPAIRGDPRGSYTAEERVALQKLHSPRTEDRLQAVWLLAGFSAREREAGRTRHAEHYAGLVRQKFAEEKDGRVRDAIVSVACPIMAPGSPPTWDFLRERLAEGRYAGSAALALAASGAPGAYEDIVPLTAHPLPAARWAGAMALCLLGDPRGRASIERVLAEMAPDQAPEADGVPARWPHAIRGMSFAEARAALHARLQGSF